MITDDGRPFLELTDETYDLIVVDAYHQPYIPFYLATREFFQAVREHLRPGGVVALNVASVPGDERLSEAIGSTLARRVPRGVALAAASLQRAHARVRHGGGARRARRAGRGRLRPRSSRSCRSSRTGSRPVVASERPLTDDRAPVEWLTDRMIIDFISRGGELDEDYLPTRP